MTPNVKKLWRFGLQGKKGFAQRHQLFKIQMIGCGIKAIKIFLQIKGTVCGDGAAVLDTRVLLYKVCNTVIVVDAAAGIGHTDHFVAHKLR